MKTHPLTVFSFSAGMSKTHLSLESIRSSGLASFHLLTTPSVSVMSAGASRDCTMNLCLLFSFGS
uniref:Uncharacterized protein n=1 Tax=Sinocyclocheilus rhinocerous TaxID=307959 RepID=A0A673LIW8_9TELE